MRVFVSRQRGEGEGSGSAGQGGPRCRSMVGVASSEVIQLARDYCPVMESFSGPRIVGWCMEISVILFKMLSVG